MIEVKNLSHSYGKFKALNNVSFTIEQGDFIGLIGPNGAGKTTLMNTMVGILAADSGEVLVDGAGVEGFQADVRRKIGYMPSELATYEMFSPEELLKFLAAMYNLDTTTASNTMNNLFDKLEMREWKKKSIKKLSTGMKKKTAFAAAILHAPDLLVLDEPFESVDPISQHKMKDLLHEYLENGGAVIMSSHVLDTVENICNKFILMNKGEIIKQSTINALDGSLADEFFELVNALNIAHEETIAEDEDEAQD
ncbi:MAG: ABC transporter ATP-binding protein [Clostridia bacterium]|nr:ABC transporter ATP-binding protein [Clostridia bacterium]